jgi:type IV pilus assembly protein PilM
MLQLLGEPAPAIGLDVGSESIKILQLAASTAGGLAVGAALRVPLPDDVRGDPDRRVEFAGETVRTALRQGAFRGRRIVAALPKELVHYKTHRLPPMAADELPMAARIDARDLFRFDPDSADVQCIDAGEVRQGDDRRREVILVAAGKRYVDQFVHALDRAGAVVASLEIDPTAVWRAAAFRRPAETRNTDDAGLAVPPRVLLDVGAAQSRLVIGRGDTIRLIRTIDVGADTLRTAISRKLGLSVREAEQLRRRAAAAAEPDAGGKKLDGMRQVLGDATRHATELLAREVLACVRYHAVTFRGPAPRAVELTGGEAGDAHIPATLGAAIGLPATCAELFRGIDTAAIPAGHRTAGLGEWAVALGLAMKGFGGSAGTWASARAGEQAPPPDRKQPAMNEAARLVSAAGGGAS